MPLEIIEPGLPDGKSDLFNSGCQALVNAANCVGIMGAGIARQFRVRYPQMFEDYRRACAHKELTIEQFHTSLHTYKVEDGPWIVNFPTMYNPGEATQWKTIFNGLMSLEEFVIRNHITSIAIPALGCGIGSFDFDELAGFVDRFSKSLPDLDVKLYKPQ